MVRVSHLVLFGAALFGAEANATDSKVCGQCHAEIYQRYAATPMALTSGTVDSSNAPIPKEIEFTDSNRGTHFRLEQSAEGAIVHFSKGGSEGERRLDYFIGAGVMGRSYASDIDGFLFQSPVAYYSSTAQWDLSPGFEATDRLAMMRPIEPACLTCHGSGLRMVAGTVNGYQKPVFVESGVSCERCHGAGDVHVARMKTKKNDQGSGIVNPAKLNFAERDSICAQCHLTGEMRIAKTGRVAEYVAGQKLFDSTSIFLWSNGTHQPVANSHFEQLVQSACWRRSNSKLWCGTCHDPHTTVAEGARTKYYRERCLTCHTLNAPGCSAPAQLRRAATDDCVSCHMPSKAIGAVQHSAQTDHTILRIPRKDHEAPAADASLIPFPGSSAGHRELALAYASEALAHNNRTWGTRAISLLKETLAAYPDDAVAAEQLAQLYDRAGRAAAACELFGKAVRESLPGVGALVNFGNCQADRGDMDAAMTSWSQALRRNPGLEAARLNLAVAQYRSGNIEAARANLRTALKYDPFSQRARELLQSIPDK